MRKLIEVKEKHIKNGLPCKSASCPIALALNDAGYQRVLVDTNVVRINSGSYIGLPTRVKRFIQKFDRHKPVKPFKFWFNQEVA